MNEFIKIFTQEESSLLLAVLSMFILSFLSTMLIHINNSMRDKKTNAKSREIYRLVKEQEQNSKVNLVETSVSNIPVGLSEEEYFSKMKSILLELSYSKLKNGEDSPKDDAIEDLIRSHHEQALAQASIQFWSSLIASIIGFVFIVLMILFANNSQWYEYILKVIPGVIIEAVSYLFFKQSSETRARASDFLNRLRNDEQISKSITIADSIGNDELKSLIKAKIALHICGINELQDLNDFCNVQ